MAQLLLTVNSVVVGYDRPLHQPLSFTVNVGDIILLHGDNGAGKSSFIGALANTVKIWQGHITRSQHLRVALQPQQPIQRKRFPLKVQEYLAILKCKDALPDRLKTINHLAIADLSYGQLHLLSIWASIHSSAQLILLDEPTNHLDKEAKQQVLTWLQELRDNQAAIIISHDNLLATSATQHIEVIAQ